MGDKLKKILSLSKDIPYFSGHLKKLGLSTKNIQDAINAGALERLSTGLYQFSGVPLSSFALIESLQTQGWSNFHIGATTALLLRGQAQYMRKVVFLYSPKQIRIPSLKKILHSKNIQLRVSGLFGESKEGLEKFIFDHRNLTISCTERAILEAIDLLTSNISSEELIEIFEHLPPLNEEKFQKLLRLCRSKRVIRIFGFLCERQSLKFKNLTYEKILRMSGSSMAFVDKEQASLYQGYWKLMIPKGWANKDKRGESSVELP